jgi:hypothetical protein
MSLSLVIVTLILSADEVPPDKAAAIELQQQKAQAEVSAKYGNKKLSELSQDERRQMVRDSVEADKKVLEKNGVDAKDWQRQQMKKDRAEYAEGKQRVKDLAEKEKAEEEKKKAEAGKSDEVQIQRGITDSTPVTLDEKPNEGGKVPVEEGLPPEVLQEMGELDGDSSAAGGAVPDLEQAAKMAEEKQGKPAKGGKGGGKRR